MLGLQLSTVLAQGTGFTLLTTITNPAPTIEDLFGYSVATLGDDRLLIGAPQSDTGASDAGVVRLFNTNGVLLITLTNPSPAASDHFGFSVAALGHDRILVGAPHDDIGEIDSGAVYLFSTTGVLLTTFTNPPPSTDDWFGFSVAAVGTDRVLIGTPGKGPSDAGTAYLFNTNGDLIHTFNAGATITAGIFGWSVAAVGKDRVLIGAPSAHSVTTGLPDAGTVYLFSTDGVVLATFNSPTPKLYERFGSSVAAVGNDQVLVGAPQGGSLGAGPGAAYLFRTNGMLLTAITNPAPATYDYFGSSVAAVGRDRLMIGAFNDDMGVGAAYLFSTNGALITSLTKPPPPGGGSFGISLAALGSDQILIGALYDDIGAGVAYLFSIAPSLTIRLTTTSTVAVSWPSSSTGWTLQENTNGLSSANWSNALGPIQDDGTNKTVLVGPPTGSRFYRLFKP